MPVILPISGSSKAANVKANAIHFQLKPEDLDKIDHILKENRTIGHKSYGEQRRYMEG